jgi:hypothetical protein
MGQAKLRGTYEQRKAEGKLRVAREFIKQENEIKRLDASLSLKEKEKRHAALKLIANAAAYRLGL